MGLGITRKQLGMVAVLLAGTFLAVLNATLLTPALPHIMSDMGLLVDHIGWRAIFVIVTAAAAVVLAVACLTLESFGSFKRTRFDAPSVALSSVGLVCLLYGLSTFSSSANHAVTAVLVVAGVALIGLYARRQLALEEPMLRVGILRTRNYRTAVVVIALFQAALMGMETVMPLYIQGTLGQPATVSGLTLLPGSFIGAVTGFFAGRLFDRYGVRKPMLVGGTVITVAAVCFALLRADTLVVLVSVVYALMAIGIQFTMTPLNTWGVNSLPNDAIQHAQSTSNTINQVAGSFGTALLVSIAAAVSNAAVGLGEVERTFAGYHAAFCTTAILAVAAVAVVFVFVRERKGAAAPASAKTSTCAPAPVASACARPDRGRPASDRKTARLPPKGLAGGSRSAR